MNREEVIECIVKILKPKDDLKRIELEFKLEEMISEIQQNDVFDTEMLIDFSLMQIPFTEYLKAYKNISSVEARALVAYGYVTYYDFMSIMNFGLSGSNK